MASSQICSNRFFEEDKLAGDHIGAFALTKTSDILTHTSAVGLLNHF